jgi:HEAT repeat protein
MNLTQIAAQLFSDDVTARLDALATLAEQVDLPSLPQPVLHGLLDCLGHTRKAVQRGAAAQLVRFAPGSPDIKSALIDKLTAPDPRVRWTAAFTLAQLDLPEPFPLSVLIENLGHEESDLRWAAATAVLRLAALHPHVTAEMVRLAGAGNAVQRRMALYCLRDLGETGQKARAAYFASLADPDPMVRLAGLSCLGKLKIVTATAQDTLLHLLEADPDPGVRRATAVTLGQIGNSAPAIIGALIKTTRQDDASLKKAATGALERLLTGRATVH